MHLPVYIVARMFILAYALGFAALAGVTSKAMTFGEFIIAAYFLSLGAVIEYRFFHLYVGTVGAVALIAILAAVGAIFGRSVASWRTRRAVAADQKEVPHE